MVIVNSMVNKCSTESYMAFVWQLIFNVEILLLLFVRSQRESNLQLRTEVLRFLWNSISHLTSITMQDGKAFICLTVKHWSSPHLMYLQHSWMYASRFRKQVPNFQEYVNQSFSGNSSRKACWRTNGLIS